MGWVFKFAQSSMGAKVLMALSGVLLFGLQRLARAAI